MCYLKPSWKVFSQKIFLQAVCHLYRKTAAFYELILYSATLLKMSISYKSSLVEFLGSLTYGIFSSSDKNTLASSFSICILLISSNSLIVLAKISNAILNKYGHPGLVHDFSGISLKQFKFMLKWDCWGKLPLLCWSISLVSLISSGILSWKDVGVCKKIFYIWWNDKVVFVFHMVDYIYQLMNLLRKTYVIIVEDIFDMFLGLIHKNFISIFESTFIMQICL